LPVGECFFVAGGGFSKPEARGRALQWSTDPKGQFLAFAVASVAELVEARSPAKAKNKPKGHAQIIKN
jgi:hypothetical protein